MPKVTGAPQAMNAQLESAYASAKKKYKGNEKKASKIAWGAVKNAGWSKGKDGKWKKSKTTKEMTEMLTKELEIFAVGNYPQGKFGLWELQEIADSYNPDVHQAPQVLGHASDYPDSRAPAAGWINSLKVVGDKLIAIGECSEKLVEAVKQGLFRKRSIGLYAPTDASNPTPGKWHLHHLAWLGAQPPQVKGLMDPAFSEFQEDDRTKGVDVEFSDVTMDDMEQMANDDTTKAIELEFNQCLAKVQEYLVATDDDDDKKQKIGLALSDCYYSCQKELDMHFAFIDKAETITGQEHGTTTNMMEKIKRLFSFNHSRKESTDMDDKVILKFQEEQAKLRAELEALKAADAKRQTEFQEAETRRSTEVLLVTDARLRTEISEFIEAQGKLGRSPNKLREMKVDELMFRLAKETQPVNLAEGKTTTMVDLFKSVVGMIPAAQFGETKGFAPSVVATAHRFGTPSTAGKVDEMGAMRVTFAENYLEQHKSEEKYKRLSRPQALSSILVEMANGLIIFDPITL